MHRVWMTRSLALESLFVGNLKFGDQRYFLCLENEGQISTVVTEGKTSI